MREIEATWEADRKNRWLAEWATSSGFNGTLLTDV